MAGRNKPYKDRTLAELETAEAEKTAAGQRIPKALAEALAAARLVDADMPADEVAALEDDGKVVEGAAELAADEASEPAALAPEMPDAEIAGLAEDLAAQEAAGEPEADGGPFVSASPGTSTAAESAEPAYLPDSVNAKRFSAANPPAETADEAAAKVLRKEFTKRVAQLMDAGFTEAQAVEALTREFPAEAAEYATMGAARPPKRDLCNVDMKTGEIRPAQPYAIVDATPYPVTFYRPVLKVIVPDPDDPSKETVEELTCQHVEKYGHSSEDAALKCARSMAYKRGLRLA